jgi:ABC-type multidrug transport system fused ATPase/permease subunit
VTVSILEAFKIKKVLQATEFLSGKDKVHFILLSITQILLSLMDLIGIGLLGIASSLAISGNSNSDTSIKVLILSKKYISDYSSSAELFVYLGFLACSLLILRTIFSVILTKYIFRLLAEKSAFIAEDLVIRYAKCSPTFIDSRSSFETSYAFTTGLERATVGILGTFITLISDIGLLLVLMLGLLVIDITMAIQTLVFFGAIAWLAHKLSTVRSTLASQRMAKLTVEANEDITNLITNYREIYVKGRRSFFSSAIGVNRLNAAATAAELAFVPYVGKYLLESAIMLGALGFAGSQLIDNDLKDVIGSMTMFLVAGTRIAPAVLRLQQGTLQLNSASASAEKTFILTNALKEFENQSPCEAILDIPESGLANLISAQNVSFQYDAESNFVLDDVNIELRRGEVLAIVGRSGSGKSTLVDLLLGLLQPNSGECKIEGLQPNLFIAKHPGDIAYIPQNVQVTRGTIRQNVGFGFPLLEATDEKVMHCLRMACLDEFVNSLPLGIDTLVSERGINLSGGQKQRLALARAFFTKPTLIFMDEATSALDVLTETMITDTLKSIQSQTTLVIVAHRLSTVKEADQIIYLESGKVIARGSFTEIRKKVPNFDLQAGLLGL